MSTRFIYEPSLLPPEYFSYKLLFWRTHSDRFFFRITLERNPKYGYKKILYKFYFVVIWLTFGFILELSIIKYYFTYIVIHFHIQNSTDFKMKEKLLILSINNYNYINIKWQFSNFSTNRWRNRNCTFAIREVF